MSLTEQIYEHLWKCVREGLPYEEVYAKWGESKGPFYTALGRFLREAGVEVSRLRSEWREAREEAARVRAELQQLNGRLRELEQKVKEKEASLSSLTEREREAEERLRGLEERRKQRAELLESLERLEEAGVGMEELRKLLEALRGISARRKADPREAVRIFFSLLPSFDPVLGLELELERLQASLEAKRAEAGRWEAEAERLRMRCAEDEEAVRVVRALARAGARDHLFAWERILNSCGKSPVELEEELRRYGSLVGAIREREKELRRLEEEGEELRQEVQALEKRRRELSAHLRSVQEEGVRRVGEVRREAEASIHRLVDQLKEEVERAKGLMVEAGRLEEDLRVARAFRTLGEEPRALLQLRKGQALLLCDLVRGWAELRGFNPTTEGMNRKRSLELARKLLAPEGLSLREVLDLARELLLRGGMG